MSAPQVNTNAHIAKPVTETVEATVESEDSETFDSAEFQTEEAVDVGSPTDTTSSTEVNFDEDESQDDALVEVFNEKCLSCSHLVSFATKKYKDCHFSKGNDHCPAQSVKITIRIPVEKVVRRFMVAIKTGDVARLGQLYTTLASKEPWYQERITSALAKARQDEGV